MKTVSLLLLTTILSYNLIAQHAMKIFIDSQITTIRLKNVDTLITLESLQGGEMYNQDTLIGIGAGHASSVEYILYLKNDSTFIVKCVDFYIYGGINNKPKEGIYKSKPLLLKNTDLINCIKFSGSLMQEELILPNIYKYEINGETLYNVNYPNHILTYFLSIYIGEKLRNQRINDYDLIENNYPLFIDKSSEKNLNYKHNINTKLYKFLTDILEEININKRAFNFQ